jgi:hypothetical protein
MEELEIRILMVMILVHQKVKFIFRLWKIYKTNFKSSGV